MRMTKELAKNIATKLTEKSKASVEECYQSVQVFVTSLYIKATPLDVLSTYKKHPEFFYAKSSIYIHGTGIQYQYIPTSEKVIANNGTEANLQLVGSDASKFTSLYRKWDSEKRRHSGLKKEIEVALYSLRTFTQIEKHLPEAVPFLPKSESLAVAKNFTKLRKLIQEAA